METAQRLVDEAAKKAGYSMKAYHGTRANKNEFNNILRNSRIGALGPAIYLSPSEEGPKAYSNLEGARGFVIPAFVRGENLFKISHVNRSSEEYFKHFDPYGKLSDQAVQDKAKSAGFDGVLAESGGIDGAGEIAVFDPSQIKSAEPATYDNKGNLIPLSERFNIQSDDIRFSPARTLNKRGGAIYTTEQGHRAVQTSSRAGVRVYDKNGKRIGPVFQSVEKAERHLAKENNRSDGRFSPGQDVKDRVARRYLKQLDRAVNNPRELPKDLQEAWDIGRSVADAADIYEEMSRTPDWVYNFGNDVTQFFEAGKRGEAPRYVVGYRRGPIPESGRSKNYASGDAEAGVSLAYAHNLPGMETNPMTMAGVSGRGITLVSGWTFPDSLWGSDGELVVLSAKEIKKK